MTNMSLISASMSNATATSLSVTLKEDLYMSLLYSFTTVHFIMMSYWDPLFSIFSMISNVCFYSYCSQVWFNNWLQFFKYLVSYHHVFRASARKKSCEHKCALLLRAHKYFRYNLHCARALHRVVLNFYAL